MNTDRITSNNSSIEDLKKYFETIGDVQRLFNGEFNLRRFEGEIHEAATYCFDGKKNDNYPTKSVVSHMWGSLYIELQYYPSQLLLSNWSLDKATYHLVKSLKRYLIKSVSILHEDQVNWLVYSEKGRIVFKSIISLKVKEDV